MNIITQLCAEMASREASDLFLSAGRRPYARIGGLLQEDTLTPAVTIAQIQEFVEQSFPSGTWKQLLEDKDMDMGITIPAAGRFRVNLSFQRGVAELSITWMVTTLWS